MDLPWLDQRAGDDEPVGAKIGRCRSVDATIETVRRISTQLRPKLLDDLGLAAAIEWQAGDFERRSGVACRAGPSRTTWSSTGRSTALFRIFQETLTNVARHAARPGSTWCSGSAGRS